MVDWDSHDESPKHITSANVTDDDVEAFYRHRKRMKRQAEIAAQEAAEAAANAPPVDPRKQELVDLMKTVHTNMQTLSMMAHTGGINDWISEEEATHTRTCAESGSLKGLEKIKAERANWAAEGKNYLALISWDMPDALGNTALMLAVMKNRLSCVQFLLAEGASPNKGNNNMDSPLHLCNTKEVAEALLEAGANPAAIDKFERTPYEIQRAKRYSDMSSGMSKGHSTAKTQASTAHLAFKKEHQIRAKRSKRHGKPHTSKAEHAKAQAEANAKLEEHQRELDKAAHDALIAKAEEHFLQAQGYLAMLNGLDAVKELKECLGIFPDHEGALHKLRDLASSKGPSESRQPARAALLSLVNPEGEAESAQLHAVLNVANNAEHLVEATAIFHAMDSEKRGFVTMPQLTSRLCDFGLEEHQVSHISMLMDINADNRIDLQEFLAGFTRFKLMAHGHGAISLTARDDAALLHWAHKAEKHVIDDRFAAMQAMKAEAHSLVLAEAPQSMAEPDTLSIGGLPHCFFSGCRDELEEGVRVAELVHDFGMVLASTATVVDSVFGNRCSALAKFAMVCSVEEAMETGLTVKDKDGADLQLELTVPKSDDFFVKVQLRHLDLLARSKEEEAAVFRKEHDETIQAAKAEQAGVPATLPDRPHSAHALRGPSRAPDRPQSAR